MIKKKIKMQYKEKGKLYIDNSNVFIGNNSIENISNKDNDVLYDKYFNLGNDMLYKIIIGIENDGKGKDVD